MKKAIYIITTIFLLIILGAYTGKKGFWDGKTRTYPNPKGEVYTKAKQIEVTLLIDYSPDNVLTFETKADEGDSVFNLLRTVAAKESIDLKVKEYDFGILVEAIGGFENSKDKAWIYFVNDKPGDVGADQKIFDNGDVVKWKYISPTEIN